MDTISLESNQEFVDSKAHSDPMKEVESSIDRDILLSKLNKRQQKIIELLEEGYNQREITRKTGISYGSVIYHIKKIRELFN